MVMYKVTNKNGYVQSNKYFLFGKTGAANASLN